MTINRLYLCLIFSFLLLPLASMAEINLSAKSATLTGDGLVYDKTLNAISQWTKQDQRVSWSVSIPSAGEYSIELDAACKNIHSGSLYEVTLQGGAPNGSSILRSKMYSTGLWDSFESILVGLVIVDAPGEFTLSIKPLEISGKGLMNLRGVSLRKGSGTDLEDPDFKGVKREGLYLLPAISAKITGSNPRYDASLNAITQWRFKREYLSWKIDVKKPGAYPVTAILSCIKKFSGSKFVVMVGDETFHGEMPDTERWDNFQAVKLGTVTIERPGTYRVIMKPEAVRRWHFGNLNKIVIGEPGDLDIMPRPLPSIEERNATWDEAAKHIGTWDGKTESLTLKGPYENPQFAKMDVDRHSFFYTPWRGYVDTWPISRVKHGYGYVNSLPVDRAEAVSKLMADMGCRTARFEIAWHHVSYDEPALLPQYENRAKRLLTAMAKHGIRPLILLNANHGLPVPYKKHTVTLLEPLKSGDRVAYIKEGDRLKPGYSGFHGTYNKATPKARKSGYPLITRVIKEAPERYRCELSLPIHESHKAGQVTIHDLKYLPFSPAVFKDGRPNPASQKSLDGWREYTKIVCDVATKYLGTEGKADSGFDLEAWNEYSFGSDFLFEERYHQPRRQFKGPIEYKNHGMTFRPLSDHYDHEVILAITADYINDAKHGLKKVGLASGFAGQRLDDAGQDMWPGVTALSSHFYTRIDGPYFKYSSGRGFMHPESFKNRKYLNKLPYNALGELDGEEDGDAFFVPVQRLGMPEKNFSPYEMLNLTRRTKPWPYEYLKGHQQYRYANPGFGPGQQHIWFTEFNLYRYYLAKYLQQKAGVKEDDKRLLDFCQYLGTKVMLRTTFFYLHQGVERMYMYNLFGSKRNLHHALGFSSLPMEFSQALNDSGGKLTPEVMAKAGTHYHALKNMNDFLSGNSSIEEARAVTVDKVVEYKPRLIYKGNGTAANPDKTHKDELAILPYQSDDKTYVVPVYVVTHYLGHVWDPSKTDVLDPTRYNMPPQDFEITLGNIKGQGASVEYYDPLIGSYHKAEIVSGSDNQLTIKLPVVDYPRLLRIKEDASGPLLSGVSVKRLGAGTAELKCNANVDGTITASYGPYPSRKGHSMTWPVSAGQSLVKKLDNFATDYAVRLTYKADSRAAQWPRWDHDLRGKVDFTPKYTPRRQEQQDEQNIVEKEVYRLDKLPPLYSDNLPLGFSVAGLDGVKQSEKSWQQGDVELYAVQGGVDALMRSIPRQTELDEVIIHSTMWNGAPAWKVEMNLNSAAHPMIKTRNHVYYIAPLKSGYAVIAYRGKNPLAGTALKDVSTLRRSVTFK